MKPVENNIVGDFIQKKIRNRLVSLREKSGLTLPQLAQQSEIDEKLLQAIEAGEEEVTVEIMLHLLSFYGNIIDEQS